MIEPLLIPQPATLEPAPAGSAPFVLRADLSIVVASGVERGEWVAAGQVQAALRAHGIQAPIQPQILTPDTSNTIVLAVRGRDEAVFPDAGGRDTTEESREAASEAYALSVDGQRITVWGESSAGLARGVQTLCQLLAGATGMLDALRIADAPALPWRGVMLDISRGKVPTLDTLKRVVDLISFYKLNMLQLYTEHTFASRRRPEIGRSWGALTPEEIVALDHYCRDRYVELVPCLQSFGHLHRILELPRYAHLAESEKRVSLAPTVEESYTLLDDLYADHLACFSSRYFNVCSDETYDLGRGQSKEVAERDGPGRLYLGHIKRLHALATRYGRTAMVWDDIFLHYPDLVREIPKDMILLNWSYEAEEDYPQVQGFHEAGLQQIICPGTSSWNTLFPRLANARGNIRNFVAAGRRAGAIGVLTTDWGDGGHPNLLGGSWYGYAYGGAEGWSPGVLSDEEFERRFAALHFGPKEATSALAAMRYLTEAVTLPGVLRRNGSYTMELFFADPLTNEQCRAIPAEALARMHDLAAQAHNLLAGLNGAGVQGEAGHAEVVRTLTEYRLAANQILHAANRTQVARHIAAATGDAARRELDQELIALKQDLHALRLEYQWIWLARNKPEGLWLTLDKFDRSAQAIDQWRAALKPGYYWD